VRAGFRSTSALTLRSPVARAGRERSEWKRRHQGENGRDQFIAEHMVEPAEFKARCRHDDDRRPEPAGKQFRHRLVGIFHDRAPALEDAADVLAERIGV